MLDGDGDDALQAKCEAVAGKSGGSGVDMLGVTPMFVEVTICLVELSRKYCESPRLYNFHTKESIKTLCQMSDD